MAVEEQCEVEGSFAILQEIKRGNEALSQTLTQTSYRHPIVVRLHLNFHLNFLLLLVKAGVTMLIFEVVFIPSDKQFIYKRAPGQKGT